MEHINQPGNLHIQPGFFQRLADGGGFRVFAGGGLGTTIFEGDYVNAPDVSARFSMDFFTGLEYDYRENITLNLMFNIFLPNLSDQRAGEKTIVRFMLAVGATYYFRL